MKIPFTGATPVNSTEETEKSITPTIDDQPELSASVTPTQEIAAAAKTDENAKNEETAFTTTSPNTIPDALVYKYNRYCDRIYERIGAILKQSFDPVNVRLSTSITTKVKKPGQKKKKKR